MFNDAKSYATEKGMQTDFSETNSYDQGGGGGGRKTAVPTDIYRLMR